MISPRRRWLSPRRFNLPLVRAELEAPRPERTRAGRPTTSQVRHLPASETRGCASKRTVKPLRAACALHLDDPALTSKSTSTRAPSRHPPGFARASSPVAPVREYWAVRPWLSDNGQIPSGVKLNQLKIPIRTLNPLRQTYRLGAKITADYPEMAGIRRKVLPHHTVNLDREFVGAEVLFEQSQGLADSRGGRSQDPVHFKLVGSEADRLAGSMRPTKRFRREPKCHERAWISEVQYSLGRDSTSDEAARPHQLTAHPFDPFNQVSIRLGDNGTRWAPEVEHRVGPLRTPSPA